MKVPSVSGSSNTDIYMYYGNSGITSSTQNAAGVWSNGYEAIYHLHDDWNDSTGSHNGTNTGCPDIRVILVKSLRPLISIPMIPMTLPSATGPSAEMRSPSRPD